MSELKHHGILGQKKGVRNGPPYPLGRSVSTGKRLRKVTKSRDYKNANKIYDTLTKREKFYVTADEKIPKQYVTKEEYSKKNDVLIYSKLLKVDKVPVAVVDAWRHEKTAEISILTNRNERGKGYASEIVEDMIDSLNKNPEIEEILWGVHKDNKSSIGLAKKYGFDVLIEDVEPEEEWITLIKKLDKK